MRIKKWEKWYWGIVLTLMTSFLVWVILREKGFVFEKKDGGEVELSKLQSALIVIANIIPLAWFWFCLRFFFLELMILFASIVKKSLVEVLKQESRFVRIVMKRGNIKEFL